MDDIVMPEKFPGTDFRAFGLASRNGFAVLDPFEKLRQFTRSWQAVRYRYRLCAESNEDFKSLLSGRTGMTEELTYNLERCIYVFFLSGLSVFESFAFCLYFVGNKLRADDFPHVAKPKKITLDATSKAFSAAFPQAVITKRLSDVAQTPEFKRIDEVRNIVAHRVSGRAVIRIRGVANGDETDVCMRETIWHVPKGPETLELDENLLQRHLDDITSLLVPLTSAAREFAEQHHPAPEHR